MKQLSQEWFDARKGRVTGSQIGAILGVNPWSSNTDAMRSMLGYSTFTGNVATEYGSRNEANAIADFELETNIIIKECGFILHPEFDWLGASPDGLIGADAIAEIKCPFGLRDDPEPKFKKLADQPHYYAQVQYEMYCSERTTAYFIQWNRFKFETEIVLFDPEFIESSIPELKLFHDQYIENMSRDDSLFVDEYNSAKEKLEIAKDEFEQSKQKIIDRAKLCKTGMIGKLSVAMQERKGSVVYKNIPELAGVDLEQYRAKPSKFWTVK